MALAFAQGNNVVNAAAVTSLGSLPSWFTMLTMVVCVSRK
jgi:hypothetical protein